MKPYSDVPGLHSIYLEDSFFTRIEEREGGLSFTVDAVLTEDHPVGGAALRPLPGDRAMITSSAPGTVHHAVPGADTSITSVPRNAAG